jgi:predicted nucleic acid-binding protein
MPLEAVTDTGPLLHLDELGALGLAAAEQHAIAVARANAGAILFTDDAAARLAAETLGLRVHGTIGIILRAARRGQRQPAAVLALLERIPGESTLHIRRDLLRDIVEQFRREYGL